MLAAIIVAAGKSQRLGSDKLSAEIAGKPVLDHSLHAFASSTSVAEIVVVTREELLPRVRFVLSDLGKPGIAVLGGAERQDSVRNGLAVVGPTATFIAIHDAARPLITPEEIEAVYMAAREHGAASLAAPVPDTLKRCDPQGFASESIDRQHVFGMQTPQIFRRDLLEEACARVAADKVTVTDEASAIDRLGHKVALVTSDDFNFKITYARDLKLAEMVLRARLGTA